MKKLLVVDLLAEREAFGKKGVEEIVSHFPEHEVLLWAPHTDDCVDYQFGKRIDSPEDSDVIVITGSRRNVSQWEPWMDDVADLIRTCTVPLYGICFGHQIICKALGGEVIRADSSSKFISEVSYKDGTVTKQLFTHQDHVVDSGEMEVVGSAEHCEIAVCEHPTRQIKTVQYHPEAVHSVLEYSLECGDMSHNERDFFGDGIQDLDVTESLLLT
jgi:GMP synthase-like glutamine amidotransferase